MPATTQTPSYTACPLTIEQALAQLIRDLDAQPKLSAAGEPARGLRTAEQG